MENWVGSPLIVVAGLAAASALTSIGIWVGKVNSDQNAFIEFMQEIRTDIKEIRASIHAIFIRLPSSPVTGDSPLRLTGLGKSISKALSGRAWAEELAPELAERVRGCQPYEIHDVCFDYVRNEFEPTADLDAKIRACAYEHAMSRDQVLDVVAVELRDRLLELAGTPASDPGSTR